MKPLHLRAMKRAWLANGPVPGPNVDALAGVGQIREALSGSCQPSLLAIQYPQHTVGARERGESLDQAMIGLRQALAELVRDTYEEVSDLVVIYHVSGHDGELWGVMCLVDPTEVRDDGFRTVSLTEDTYDDIVAERAAVLRDLGCATSAVLLTPMALTDELTPLVRDEARRQGPASLVLVDDQQRRHSLWQVNDERRQQALLREAGTHPLLVADGNHRVAATLAADLGGLLALVTAGPDLRLGAFHRCLTGTGLDTNALIETWRQAGFQVTDPVPAAAPDTPGTMVVLTRERAFAVHFPQLLDADGNLRLDHETLELALLTTTLHLQPGGGSLQPLPTAQFDGTVPQSADALFLMAPVPLEHMVTLYRQGRRMPRKSTYFTPKPHSGILLAALV
ncbi:DUF1015 family protein [Pseudomonas maumuensis]|uniref:DUF1015 domain-containing protein n=1 Tax=Pseudomonas maumuensis TaxID=2842354 RepID=A0ABX8NQ93_9PSED|nr:DUF1015 family protein [Pseudomonas maumuensis]QXH58216.1 DUF1015 domain-containing protein [Pseudomonas maumuensis]